MSDKTHIEWTDATWNVVTGCAKVSQGCKNCYALRDWPRLAANPKTVYFGREFTDVRCHHERLEQPMRWTKPRMIFVNSMSDLFHPDVPDFFIDQVFAVMARARHHTFQVLTKRPDRMREYLNTRDRTESILFASCSVPCCAMEWIREWPLPNLWLGVSVEDQAAAEERIPLLLTTPAAVRWISAEPLLGPIDIRQYLSFNPVYESERNRGSDLRSGEGRGIGDPAGRYGVEDHQEGVGSLATKDGFAALQTGPSGEQHRQEGILPSARDVGQGSILLPGSPLSVAPLSRTDTGGDDHQPQERDQDRQSTGQPGIGNSLGATNSRRADITSRTRLQSERREELDVEADQRSSDRNTQTSGYGRNAEVDSSRLQCHLPNNLQNSSQRSAFINWTVCGGESGPKARPMHPDWARSLRNQCAAAGVAFNFKQWGEWAPRESYASEQMESDEIAGKWNGLCYRFGKKAAGRLLDGVLHDGYPR